MSTKVCVTSVNLIQLQSDALLSFVTPHLIPANQAVLDLYAAAGEQLQLHFDSIKDGLTGKILSSGHAVFTPAYGLTNFKMLHHVSGPEIAKKKKPTRTQEQELRLAVISGLSNCMKENNSSVIIIMPPANGFMNYPCQDVFFLILQSIFGFIEISGAALFDEIFILFEHESIRKEMINSTPGFDEIEIHSVNDAVSFRAMLEEQRLLKHNQRNCVPISENLCVASLVAKWKDSNESKTIRHGLQYIRTLNNQNMTDKRQSTAYRANEAAEKRTFRRNNKRSTQKQQDMIRSQSRRENEEFRLNENQQRIQRRSENISAEKEKQRTLKRQIRDVDVLEELRIKSAERYSIFSNGRNRIFRRANPLKRRFSQLVRRISRKTSRAKPTSEHLIDALPPARQEQYRLKMKEIRTRKTRMESGEILRQSKMKKIFLLERRKSAASHVKAKYNILQRIPTIVPTRIKRLVSNCQHHRQNDFPELQSTLLKRKRLLVNYFSFRNIYNPSASEINKARLEIDGLYFSGERVAEEVDKKIERIRSILVKRSKQYSKRSALTEAQNEILAIAGVHVHVRSHEGQFLKSMEHYEKVKPFYAEFGAEMREKGFRTPTTFATTDNVAVTTKTGEEASRDKMPAIDKNILHDTQTEDIPIIAIQDHEGSDSDSLHSEKSVAPSAPPLEDNPATSCNRDEECEDIEEAFEDPTTWMRGEDEECASMLPERNWASEIRKALAELENVSATKLLRHLETLEKCRACERSLCTSKNCSNFLNLLKLLAPHFMAIRTILRRYYELKEVLKWRRAWNLLESNDRSSYVEYKNLVCVESIPREIGKMIVMEQKRAGDFSHHTEDSVLLNFGKQITHFRTAVADTERFDCVSCNRMIRGSKAKRVSVTDPYLPAFLVPPTSDDNAHEEAEAISEEAGETEKDNEENCPDKRTVIICDDCLPELKKGNMPPLCVQNGLFIDDLPKELQGLHWLEYAVIRRIRPLISKFQLENAKGNKKGTFSGYKSTVMHFPVPIDNTVKKTLSDMDKLPCMENVDIAVLVANRNGNEHKYSFNLKKVIAALQWLKKNNPLYEDVQIDEEAKSIRDVLQKYDFECDSERSKGPDVEDENEENISKSKDHYMLTQLPEPSHIAHTNVDMDPPKTKASDLYLKLKDHPGDPLQTHSIEHLEAKAFPLQFPLGRGDFDTPRQVPISKTVYVHNRVRNADPRFRQADYACHLNNERDVHTMLSSCNFSAKKTMSAGALHSLVDKDQLDDDVYANFSALKGSDGFWKERRMEVNAAIEMLGPATFFFTLNPAESEWSELRSLYEQRYPHLAGDKNNSEFCSLDPLIFARHFQHRVEAAYKHLIGPKGVLGPVKDFWRRIEYQRRGAPHCHGLIWVEGAPTVGESSDEDLVKFIDKYITTRMPDPVTEPNLYQAVNKHQIHRCTDSCLTQYKKGKTKLKKCRFGHPFDIQMETEMQHKRDDEDPRARQKNYKIKRLYNALRVNPYNPAVLLAWNGNIDIQFVSETSLNTVRYVTGYIAKGETKAIATDALAGAEHLTKKDLVKQAMLLLRQREMGMPEVFARLMGQHLYDASFSVKFLNTNEKEKRVRMMKSKSAIAKLGEHEKITENNLIDDYYPNRSREMENLSLYNAFAAFEFSKKKPEVKKRRSKQKEEDDEIDKADSDYSECAENSENPKERCTNETCDHPLPLQLFPGKVFKVGKNLGYFKAKTKLKIVRFFMNDLNGENGEVEDYCRRCLLLFKPWRSEEKDLKGSFDTFQDAFQDFMTKSNEQHRKEILKLLKAKQNMLDAMKENMTRAEKRKQLEENENDEETAALEVPAWNVTEESLKAKIALLNEKQNEVFLTVSKAVDDNNPDKKHIFVSGVAGTGKSHVIHTLTDYIYLKYGIPGKETTNPPVLISAPTGKAALSIKGFTIHSLLGLGVEKGRTPSFTSLKPKRLNEIRQLFSMCKVLFIDEVSMVSNVMLMMIHRRLQEVTGNTSELFGGIMVVAFGDLLQLPPVRLPPVYQPIRKELLNQIFKTVKINFNLWQNAFEYFELTENMRQKEELEYANMLNRFRNASPNEKDFEILFERYISKMLGKKTDSKIPAGSSLEECGKYFIKLLEEDPNAIAVFGYTKAVNAFNNFVMECRRDTMGVQIIEIPAIQGPLSRKSVGGKLQRPFLRKENKHSTFLTDKAQKNSPVVLSSDLDDDAKRSGGLSKVLRLQVGARVMLTRNVPQRMQEGLVNGAMGTLQEIISSDGEVQLLRIKFDKLEKPQLIKRDFATYDVGEHMTSSRRQFSVSVSYAQTIHKSQGDTVRNVMVDLYSLFDAGQAYVAMSRSTSIKGLHVIDFHPHALKCSESAVNEYNRLREMIGMEPLPEPNVKPPAAAMFAKYSKDWATHFINREDFTEANENTLFVTADKEIVPKIKNIPSETFKPKKKPWTKTILQTNKYHSSSKKNKKDLSHNGLSIELTIRKKKPVFNVITKKKAEARKVALMAQFTGDPQSLLLENGNNYCFINSVVQAVRRCWRTEILNKRGIISRALTRLQDLVATPGLKNVRGLLKYTDRNGFFGDGHQHCAGEYFLELISKVDVPAIDQSIRHKINEAISCHCGYARISESDEQILRVRTDLPLGTLDDYLATIEAEEVLEGARCPDCDSFNSLVKKTELDVSQGCNNLVVLFNMADNSGSRIKIQRQIELPAFPHRFKGAMWNLLALVEHRGPFVGQGHYVTWALEDGNWLCHNDTVLTRHQELPPGIPNGVLMFFERL